MHWVIAKSLGTNLDASVQISMKAVSSLLIIQILDFLIIRLTMSGQGNCCTNHFVSDNLRSNFCVRVIGRVELYQVTKNSGYVFRNHEK